MNIHAYKSHKFIGTDRACLELTGLCGGVTLLHALPGEDVLKSVEKKHITMFTTDPDSVTCGSCKRSKKFSLLCLNKTVL